MGVHRGAASKDWTGGKQQLTATRLHELLIGEGHQVAATTASALAAGTPILFALTTPPATAALEAVDVPTALRDIDVPSGCAADYDGWLASMMR